MGQQTDEDHGNAVEERLEAARERVGELSNTLGLERRRLKTILHQMPSGVSVAEAPSGRLLLHNEAAVRLLRHPLLPSETVAGYVQYGALHQNDEPYAPEEYPIARALTGEIVDQEEMRYRRGDGTTTVFSVSAAPVRDEGGSICFAVSTFHDIARQETAEAEIRRMSLRLLQAQEEERRHVARELHDELGGLLTSLQMNLRILQGACPDAELELHDSTDLVETMVDKVRKLSLDLRPSILDDLGLVPALGWFLKRYEQQARIHVDLQHELEKGERLRPEVETAAYRIVQEAATNAARHAGARNLQVLVHRDEDLLVLHVVDDGRGFDVQSALERRDSTGLFGMQERAALLRGKTTFDSQFGEGARVTATIPL